MPKRTFQRSKIKRARKFGFRSRSQSKSGKRVLKRRRDKKRKKISS